MLKRLCSALLAAALLSSCSALVKRGDAGAHKNGTAPGALRVAVRIEPMNLNPIFASNTTDGMIDAFIFDLLLTSDPQGHLRPDLAEVVPSTRNGGISEDGLTITYHLRHGVKWQDGAPFTSKDVKFTWEAVMNSANNVTSRNGYDQVERVSTPDDYTVVFHLKRKYAPAVDTLFAESDSPIRILPKHLLASYANLNAVAFNQKPIGTGPFKVVRWVKGDRIELAANRAYFRGVPRLSRIVIQVIPDENTEITALYTKDIDWLFQASPNTCRRWAGIPGARIAYTEENGYESIRFNVSHAPLNDVRVRRAIAYAIDKEQLDDVLTCGNEVIATEDHPRWMGAHDPDVQRYSFDPTKARNLLAQAGFVPGPGGILQRNGQPLSLVGVTDSANITRRSAEVLVQAALRRVGIDLRLKNYPGAQLYAPAGEGGILQLGRFDLAFSGWIAGIDPDNASQYECAEIPPGGFNYTRYCNVQVDAAERTATTSYDRATRDRAYHIIERDLARDVPEIFLWWIRQAQPVSSTLHGFAPNPVTASWNAYQWSI